MTQEHWDRVGKLMEMDLGDLALLMADVITVMAFRMDLAPWVVHRESASAAENQIDWPAIRGKLTEEFPDVRRGLEEIA